MDRWWYMVNLLNFGYLTYVFLMLGGWAYSQHLFPSDSHELLHFIIFTIPCDQNQLGRMWQTKVEHIPTIQLWLEAGMLGEAMHGGKSAMFNWQFIFKRKCFARGAFFCVCSGSCPDYQPSIISFSVGTASSSPCVAVVWVGFSTALLASASFGASFSPVSPSSPSPPSWSTALGESVWILTYANGLRVRKTKCSMLNFSYL